MGMLNQIIAVCGGKKTATQKALTELYHKLQKPDLMSGIARTYRPKDEEGDQLPPERKQVQFKVGDALSLAAKAWTELFDVVATQDQANCDAKADVVCEGLILGGVPVTHLLFLEKQLVDIHAFVEKIPTLDPGEEWVLNESAGCYATVPADTVRTKKVPRAFVKAEATDKHPAQVDVFSEDVMVGYWTTIKLSGAIPESHKSIMLERVRKLQDAVKAAREQANSVPVSNVTEGAKIFEYLFD